MNLKYFLKWQIWLVTFALCYGIMTSCKKFVQIPAPDTKLVTASVFSNSATATAAQTAIYSKMSSNNESWLMSSDLGLLGDELKGYSTNLILQGYYTNSLNSLNSTGPWNNAYNYIYQGNAIIAALQNNSAIGPVIAQQLIGESKFIRAFWNFYLTNVYGDVPLVTTTDYMVNEKSGRTTQNQIYSQIVGDLSDAQNLLNANYVDATDTVVTSERVRPTKGAAEALLSRVYLYMKKYDSAESEASLVINNTALYGLCSNLSGANSVFLKNSNEAVWQLSTPLPPSFNTADGQYFILKGAPGTGTSQCNTVSTQLLGSFEPGDKRRTNWIGTFSSGGVNYYFPYKYQSYASSTVTEYVMVLRLAEQYLIRAEARAGQGNLTGAIADLNVIRNRAGLANYSGVMDQISVLAAIMHERQVELFCEWGHRWFDLKRTGQLDSVMGGPNGVCLAKGGTWISTDSLFPIPTNELLKDANLTQNPGY